jgi:hypothetical protein
MTSRLRRCVAAFKLWPLLCASLLSSWIDGSLVRSKRYCVPLLTILFRYRKGKLVMAYLIHRGFKIRTVPADRFQHTMPKTPPSRRHLPHTSPLRRSSPAAAPPSSPGRCSPPVPLGRVRSLRDPPPQPTLRCSSSPSFIRGLTKASHGRCCSPPVPKSTVSRGARSPFARRSPPSPPPSPVGVELVVSNPVEVVCWTEVRPISG